MDDALRSFYGFRTSPFGPITTPSPQIHLASRRALIDKAVASILAGRPVMSFSGERGAGKTTLLAGIAAALRVRHILPIEVSRAFPSPVQLQRLIMAALGIDGGLGLESHHLLRAAHCDDPGRFIVLLFDNADMLSAACLRYVWLLIQLFDFGPVKLHLVLVGGLGRWRGLEHPDLADLRRLADPRIMVMPLEDDEAIAYLDGKLRLAGGSRRRMMTDAALSDLLERACGVPGRLNALTEGAMAHACHNRRQRIIAPILPSEPSGEADVVLPFPSVRRGWRSASIAVFILVAAVGAGAVYRLSNEPARDAHTSALPDSRRPTEMGRDAPVVTANRMPSGS